ncbi:MAG TPA: hypothetical protein VKT82_02295 [Ktedonobacterales bacterium]|nr:hypothetical protein [Ktedonobacterales bacterium]
MSTTLVSTSGSRTWLKGRWRITARLVAIVLMALALGSFLPMLPTYMSTLSTVCSSAACPSGQLTADSARALGQVGLTVSTYADYALALTLVSLLACWGVASILFWRKSDDWMALLVGLMLVLMATGTVTYLLLQRPSPWQVPALLLNALAFAACFLVFALFPSGRFVPIWTCWVPVAWMLWVLVSLAWLNTPVFFLLHYLLWLGALVSVVGSQLYRYRRVSTLAERQQTKWVVWGVSIAIIIVVAVALPHLLFPTLVQQNVFYQLLSAPADTLALFLGSLSFGLAILRSRLWEIDHLINRTLVYGSLTGLLALVYVSLVIVLQALVRLVTGGLSQSVLVNVVSTLAIAALFQPLRRRLQQVIDRRFYRHTYDVAQTLAAFGETLRGEVDLNALCEQLMAVVQDTMQPAHISLWLLQDEPQESRKTRVLPQISGDADAY